MQYLELLSDLDRVAVPDAHVRQPLRSRKLPQLTASGLDHVCKSQCHGFGTLKLNRKPRASGPYFFVVVGTITAIC